MMVRKVILASFLVVLIAAVAYIRALYSHQAADADKPVGIDKDSAEFEAMYIERDSLAVYLDSLRLTYLDSLQAAREQADTEVDTSAFIDKISGLADSVKALQKKLAWMRTEKQVQYEEMIRKFYRQELEALPQDLSEYEKNVLLKEIHSKLRRSFNLSSKRLAQILKKK
jgi:hypothetical protein